MTNPKLARDYFERSKKRLKAVAVLLTEGAFADVVRESQETIELALKALIRSFGIAVPFGHDLSQTLLEHRSRLPPEAAGHVDRWAAISKQLRKDRELAFYGSEDVTPSDFYVRKDAEEALRMAEEVVESVSAWIR